MIRPIKTILYGGSYFNGPYWVIKDMFYSSLLIYFINYISFKLNYKVKIIIYILAILAAKFVLGLIYFSCLVGALCSIILCNKEIMNKFPNTLNNICCVLCIIMPFGVQDIIYNFLSRKFSTNFILSKLISHFGFNSSIWGTLYFAVFIVLIANNKALKEKLSNDFLCNLNKISFGVYSFHWPLICSIGALCIIKIYRLYIGIICGWLISFGFTIGISILYYLCVEINVNKILNKLK